MCPSFLRLKKALALIAELAFEMNGVSSLLQPPNEWNDEVFTTISTLRRNVPHLLATPEECSGDTHVSRSSASRKAGQLGQGIMICSAQLRMACLAHTAGNTLLL
jgi:hypothetical protein